MCRTKRGVMCASKRGAKGARDALNGTAAANMSSFVVPNETPKTWPELFYCRMHTDKGLRNAVATSRTFLSCYVLALAHSDTDEWDILMSEDDGNGVRAVNVNLWAF